MSARASASGRQKRVGIRGTSHPRKLWWLHPRFGVLFLGIPLLIGAYLVPESTYVTLYGAQKHIDLNFFAIALVVYVGFVVGSFFVVGADARPQERDVTLYCRWIVWPLFIFTVFGFVVWLAYAVLRSGGPVPLANTLIELVFRPSFGVSDYVKFELFQTLPGITTFTQFGILYATVETLLWVRKESQRRLALARIAVVVPFVLSRAILLSERLAFLEVAVPVLVILASRLSPKTIQRGLVQLAPLFLGLGVFVLFAFAEYFRSWSFYQTTYSGPYLEFAAQRFLGYYETAVNNAALVYYYEPLQPLRNTLTSLLQFPILGASLTEVYTAAFGDKFIEPQQLLETYANPEFNNVAAVGLLLNDYSVLLAPVAAGFIGLLSSSLYSSFIRGRLIGSLLYPSWFVGLLEISRGIYWSNQRYFPVLAFVVISLLLFRAAKVPVKNPPLGRGYSRRREPLE